MVIFPSRSKIPCLFHLIWAHPQFHHLNRDFRLAATAFDPHSSPEAHVLKKGSADTLRQLLYNLIFSGIFVIVTESLLSELPDWLLENFQAYTLSS